MGKRRLIPYISANVSPTVGDEVAQHGAVVGAAVLDLEIGLRRDAQLALRAVDRLIVALVGVFDRDLPVALAMGDEERHGGVSRATPLRSIAGAQAMNSSIVFLPNTHMTWSQ